MTSLGESTAVKERPVLFSGPMVRAILDGHKTQTRRVVKPQPPYHAVEVFDWRAPDIPEAVKAHEGCYYNDMDGLNFHCKCPYGGPGDQLWVREAFTVCADNNIFYRADGKPDPWDGVRWKPSIHMPRLASRITLEITGVRVERLQDISEEDALAEGVTRSALDPWNRTAFARLWESINGPDSWDANPFVWVVEFKKVTE